MSKVSDKSKEWWLARRSDGGTSAHLMPCDYSGYASAVHVIEYSVYEAVARERDKWKDEYENLSKFATQFEAERDESRAEVRRLEAITSAKYADKRKTDEV